MPTRTADGLPGQRVFSFSSSNQLTTLRSVYDDDTARFWASQTYFMHRDTLERAAVQYGLDVVQTARLFAMASPQRPTD